MNKVLLFAAVLFFLWGALLGFDVVSQDNLREDTAGWLFLGLACFAASSHPWASR